MFPYIQPVSLKAGICNVRFYKFYNFAVSPNLLTMKKILSLLLSLFVLISFSRADEGMWLPSLIGQTKLADMRAKGLKLTADDIYSINKASLKDAIVRFGGGCTAELISGQGLLITNHHCGLGQIQAHSSVEHDYITDGFWARSKSEELPNKGLSVSFLVRMDDVTAEALKEVTDNMTEAERTKQINENKKEIIKKAIEGTHYRASVESLYYGNQYFIFVYEVFTDVRLVGAPPASIGKFGGDTDNWAWPRHTGDFSMFRIYAGKDNKPADYSPENVPYQSKKSFTISLKGVKENEFTFIYGFPGRTYEYLVSDAVKYLAEYGNPHKIKLRTMRIDIMNEEMAQDKEVRIQYMSKQAGVANAWKKWQGETKGVIRLQTVAKKQAAEKQFAQWAADKPQYTHVLPTFTKFYAELHPYAFARDYYSEAVWAIEMLKFAGTFNVLTDTTSTLPDTEKVAQLTERTDAFFKDYYLPIDKKVFAAVMKEFVVNVPEKFWPEGLRGEMNYFNNDMDEVADFLFSRSLFISKNSVLDLLKKEAAQRNADLQNDPAFTAYNAFMRVYNEKINKPYNELNEQIELLYRTYMKGLMEWQKDKIFYPDANSTLRLAYGKVAGYYPLDGVYYLPYTTLEGIMEKDNPEIYDYDIPEKLRQLYASKDYGKWAVNGTVPVCFIATNHTTGGNSGSPVLNANGSLIGLNFDRTWESTMSDVVYDPAFCRNIALDIRYALFVIDKVAGAGYLLDEMKFEK